MNKSNTTNSQSLLEQSKQFIPGGVNSPVRAFSGVGGTPRFIKRGEGAYIYDEDDNCYIDYVGSWGPLIVGHAHPDVISAITSRAKNGLSFGAPTVIEIAFAREVQKIMPVLEKMRLVSSGTEATMSAIRLIRGFTGNNKIIKFIGCYHGHSDCLLVEAGSGGLTFGKPSSAGVPTDIVKHTITVDFNDRDAVKEVFAKEGNDIAGIIVEPIPGNMGMIMPNSDFLSLLRKLCDEHSALLIFDEVMSGFRVGLGGATAHFAKLGIKPDIVTLGKIIGGGMPVAAFGGRADIMDKLSPVGDVYQAGTLSGNPLALSAGMATLKLIQEQGFYEKLSELSSRLTGGLKEIAVKNNIAFNAQSLGGMFGIYFSHKIPTNLPEVQLADVEMFKKFFHLMLEKGVYFAPSAFEAGFVSSAHTSGDIEKTLIIADEVMKNL